MSTSNRPGAALPQKEWDHLEELIERFENAWRNGQRPVLDEYLKAGPTASRALMVELVHAEMECRLKAGEAVRVETYFERYADLTAEPQDALELIAAEFQLRRRREPGLTVDDYLQRFPQYGAELGKRLRPQPSPQLTPAHLSCPQCHHFIPLEGSSALEPVVCSACGGSFRLDLEGQAAGSPNQPTRLDHFELLAVVGQGAFGTVYRARDTALDRIVAIKVPRAGGRMSPAETERFVREARHAAQLSHPGIVPVYGVGRGAPVPYIVTAFVEGVTLAESLAHRRFGFREAADLVAQAAEALDSAHRQGVIHRDLKPSNILLGRLEGACPKGEEAAPLEGSSLRADLPKDLEGPRLFIMDFGLALRDEGEVTVTLDGQILGTPAYMSPEQARGDSHRVDGRSDVYSLGVILYELLTGELPFRGVTRMVLQQILTDYPRLPRQLNDKIPRDLETIALKCLAKERSHRFATAGDLAADLRRHLRGEPILARPVGPMERFRRWARRNRRVAALSGGVLFLLATVAFGSVVMAIIFDRQREAEVKAREAATTAQRQSEANATLASQQLELTLQTLNKLVYEVQDQLDDKPNLHQLKENLLNTAIPELERVAASTEHSRVDQSMVAAHDRLGEIYLAVGRTTQAQEQFERCRALAEVLLSAEPQNIQARRALMIALGKIGQASIRLGDLATPKKAYPRALELGLALESINPDRPQAQADLARCYMRMGNIKQRLGDTEGATVDYRKGRDLFAKVAAADPASIPAKRDLALAYEKIADMAYLKRDAPATREAYRHAHDLREAVAKADPQSVKARRALLSSYRQLGDASRLGGDRTAGRTNYYKALEMARTQIADDPQSLLGQVDLAISYGNLGFLEKDELEYTAAVSWFEKGVKVLQRLHAQGKIKAPSPYYILLEDQQFWSTVCQKAERAIDDLDFALAQAPKQVPQLLHFRARVLARRGRHAEAKATLEKLHRLASQDVNDVYFVACSYASCICQIASGKTADQLASSESAANKDYPAGAIAALAEAVRLGYTDGARMEKDIALAPLRQEEGLRKLVETLKGTAPQEKPDK